MRTRGTVVALVASLTFAVAGCGALGGSPERAEESGKASGGSSGGSAKKDKSWSYDRILDGAATLGDLAVVAEDDIWAYGSREGSGGEREQFLLRHDGSDWREQPFPDGMGTDVMEARLDAVGSGGVWVTASVGYCSQAQTRIVRWDGTSWSALESLPSGRLVDLKAFGPDDVWAVVGEDRAQHWDGTRWTVMTLPVGGVASLDGVAADDLWAVGYRDTDAAAGVGETELTQPVAVHWDGRSWERTERPAYRFPELVPPEPGASLDLVVALAVDDVRAYGSHSFNHGEVEDEPDDEAVRIRWDGKRWVDQAAAPEDCAERVPVLGDGSKGLFLDRNRYLAADGTCGRITWSRLPDEGGVREDSRQSLWVDELARLPGSDRVIGVGHVQMSQSGSPMSKAVVVSLREG
ncbi:hypothetical protein JIX56_16515 [Streptomyces sp. CA-210063]|uniref:hypothetical protein n=1 Tax=Streptomyces sp. CA-210063 TaxID=2801029 RepID=UPI00214CA4F5|nr:hypothetical protein [Streptomyces sp. CA-210063]UUU31377.1 hypothetical protein JIX56_16515 [Streptomyces sp. CA-210063]